MKRVVRLGDGQQVGLGQYVQAWKAVLAAPADQTYSRGLTGWWPETASEIARQFQAGMHDRINRHDPRFGRGRKWDQDWQRATEQAGRRLNTPRLVVRQTDVPYWLRSRIQADRWFEEG